MTYLLDTDSCVYWLKGDVSVREHLRQAGVSRIAISAITAAELYFGAYHSARVNENLARAEAFILQFPVLPLDNAVLHVFGRIKSELRKQGQPVADFDLLIAATAMATDRILVTNNTRHYNRIANLRIENWASA
ncbi:MAG: type II toxin-antitoxin system VapC family toxin [Chloroflexi bacterium]|nr:type II toxin-antitoxin system VapC family toxin [Chloroflexota bacterium]